MSQLTAGNIYKRLWLLHDHGFPTLRQFEEEIALIMAELDEIITPAFSFLYPMVYSSIHFTEAEKLSLLRRLCQLDIPCSNAHQGLGRFGYTKKNRITAYCRYRGLYNPFNQAMLEVLLAAGYIPEIQEIDWDTFPLEQFVWLYERLPDVDQEWKASVLTHVMKRPEYVAYLMDHEGWDFSKFHNLSLARQVIHDSVFRDKYSDRVMLFDGLESACSQLSKCAAEPEQLPFINAALEYLIANYNADVRHRGWKASREKMNRFNAISNGMKKCLTLSDMNGFGRALCAFLGDGEYTRPRYEMIDCIVKAIAHNENTTGWDTLLSIVTNPHVIEHRVSLTYIKRANLKQLQEGFVKRFGREMVIVRDFDAKCEVHFYKVEPPAVPPVPAPPRGKKAAARRVREDSDSE